MVTKGYKNSVLYENTVFHRPSRLPYISRHTETATKRRIDMSAFYTQKADQISPLFGVSSIEEARDYVAKVDHSSIVETDEPVYMNPNTGSVDFASGWDEAGGIVEVVEVEFCSENECWIEA